MLLICLVAPFMGAWIETLITLYTDIGVLVAPFMGAWIETCHLCAVTGSHWSHPSWVRGLKQLESRRVSSVFGRTLHGCVD